MINVGEVFASEVKKSLLRKQSRQSKVDVYDGKPRLAISFSGGRSSAVMLWLCLELYQETHDILITFANTGCEHEETLRFVDAVDRHFTDGKVVWIEGYAQAKGVGMRPTVVAYETAARNGEPFESAVKKHGVFCKTHPQCTSRLKEEPMDYYREKVHGWPKGTYQTAIGIRADEVDRCSSKAKEKGFVYPLVEHGWNKDRVNQFMSRFDWDLNLPNGDADGNCTWCWKKSFRKLYTVAVNNPEHFDFPARMEKEYGHITNGEANPEGGRKFFRGHTSTLQLLHDAQTKEFVPYSDTRQRSLWEVWDKDLDVGGGCGDSCEIGSDD